MPTPAPPLLPPAAARLAALGAELKAHRKRLGLSAVAVAEAAGLSRMTLLRVERGEPSVTMGAYLGVAAALGLELTLHDPRSVSAARPADALPSVIRLADYPQLKQLAWQLGDAQELTPAQALELYERNWRHVNRAAMPPHERDLVQRLAAALGGGRLLV
jgi:transcriptional regulator with XRE-family HTH domain